MRMMLFAAKIKIIDTTFDLDLHMYVRKREEGLGLVVACELHSLLPSEKKLEGSADSA